MDNDDDFHARKLLTAIAIAVLALVVACIANTHHINLLERRIAVLEGR